MENLQWYVYLAFGATLLLALWLFFKATNYSKACMVLVAGWVILQSIAGIFGFYSDPHTVTKRFPILIFPPVLFLVSLFVTKKGKAFIDGLNLKLLTILHVIRIPVEICLFWLFINKSIPAAMTFEGKNFDILSGISAPVIYYFAFVNKKIGRWGLIAWNIVCIGLLFNVVRSAVLSLPARFEQFGFEQPNIALGFFPFLLLPACLVPLVLFSNFAAIRKLITNRQLLTESAAL